jgi:tellurite resistance protein
MSDEIFGDSRRALEEAFFARENEALRRRLKEMDETKRTKEALSAASGITDDAVLEKLISLNISSETLAALSLIPLVAVAWADGSIDDKERNAVFSRASEVGVRKEDVSHELFERWLTEPPPPALVAAWKDYVRAFVATMSHEDRHAFKTEFLDRARGIAEAAGGFLGIGKKVSPPEQRVLDELARAFPD